MFLDDGITQLSPQASDQVMLNSLSRNGGLWHNANNDWPVQNLLFLTSSRGHVVMEKGASQALVVPRCVLGMARVATSVGIHGQRKTQSSFDKLGMKERSLNPMCITRISDCC